MKGLKTLGCLLALLLAAVILFPSAAQAAEISINSTNFPDAGFRAYVKKKFDKNKDGKLSAAEIKKVEEIVYCNKGCTSLKGIEHFTSLLWLDCSDNKLTKLDISKNTKLENLECYHNPIKVLDIHLVPWLAAAYNDGGDDPGDDGVCYYWHYEPYEDEETDDMGYEYTLAVDEGTVIVHKKPVVKTQPKPQIVNSGEKAAFKVKADGGGLRYQWYYKKPGASSFRKVVAASGKKATFTVTAEMAKNGYQYRCKVTNAAGYTYSKTVKLTVCALPKITSPTKATSRTVKEGNTTTFTVKATGAAKYQWYFRTSASGEWRPITATTGKTAAYKLKTAAKHNGYQYRCKVSNAAGGYVYSKTFSLKVS